MKKYDKDESLAKIKVLIGNHYENMGREMIEDTETAQKELIEDIDDVLNNTELSMKHLVIERLESDDEVREFWKQKDQTKC